MISEKRRELADISRKLGDALPSVAKRELEDRIKTLELDLGFLLPDDTMTFVTRWAMGNDVSHVKKITKENFIRAAALAHAHNRAPSDYLSGVFTDFNRNEIDAYAATVWADYQREKQAEREGNGGGLTWFLRGRKDGDGSPPRRGGE